MPITILDGIVLGVALFSAILAMVRGFSREVLSVASWVGAAAAAYFLYPYLLPYATQYTTSDTVAMIGSAGVVFLVALIIISFITMRIADFIIDSRIGALDRTLGFLFGAARGVLLVVVAMLFFNWLVAPQQQPLWVTQAKSKPLLDNLGGKLIALLPENADATILDRLRGKDTTGEGENDTPAAPADQAPAEQAPGDDAPATNGPATNG
ncbi:membrane protein required for colicin V production [Pararhizobium capsulatum DSM 1112]|uniref:Membrane protein required for colicin V production n=1 Tax=Pararhizobium capsulatum DSM 1112 TaxID=1121113 RepID=A0ABU0BPS4_9HYPH|nr:CvpA family protein [Pararhizobium capsulatum]MDQ0319749.1 membrane protein required for colicin V production [Pararhizobium capsulatum DSM 1112]